MLPVLLALSVALQVTFPLPPGRSDTSSGPGSRRSPDQSTIQGEVRTKEGEPIPLGNVSVRARQDTTRADQRGDGVGWPGAVVKVKRDGTFRVVVPGGTTYEVCAEVPTEPKQCKVVDVSTNDVQVLVFAF